MIRNGMPMRIYGFRSHQSLGHVMEEVGAHLAERGFLVGDVKEIAEMKTLGISDDRHFVNVQGQRARHGQGSSGFVVITPRPDLFEVTMSTPTVPLPDDVDVLSHELYKDGPRHGEVVLGISPRRAEDMGHALVAGFEADGWKSAPNEIQVVSDEISVYRVLTKGARLCRLITMDQVIDGVPVAAVNVNCHD